MTSSRTRVSNVTMMLPGTRTDSSVIALASIEVMQGARATNKPADSSITIRLMRKIRGNMIASTAASTALSLSKATRIGRSRRRMTRITTFSIRTRVRNGGMHMLATIVAMTEEMSITLRIVSFRGDKEAGQTVRRPMATSMGSSEAQMDVHQTYLKFALVT